MRAIGLLVGLVPLAVGCGGAPSAPSVSAPAAPVASASPSGAGAQAPVEQRLAALETVLPSARVAIHVDGKALRDAPVFTSVMSALRMLGASAPLDDATRVCGFSPIDAVDEIVVSGDDQATAAVRVSVPTDKALACVKALGEGEDATFEGQPAVRLRRGVVVASGDLLVAGQTEDLLAQALARKGKGPTELASAVTFAPGEVAAVRADTNDKDVTRVDARLVATASDLGLHARLECSSEAAAQAIAAQKDMVAQMAASAGPETRDLVKGVEVRPEGRAVVVAMGVHGDAKAQAQFVSAVAASAISGMRQYVANAKTAEARSTVRAIATALEGYATEHGKLPPSAPPVPKDPPRGTKYQSSPGDWRGTWKTIGFAMTEPQYYSYAIQTAPGGKSATIVAHGDLNGDGKASTFEMTIELGAGKDKGVKRGRVQAKDELE